MPLLLLLRKPQENLITVKKIPLLLQKNSKQILSHFLGITDHSMPVGKLNKE